MKEAVTTRQTNGAQDAAERMRPAAAQAIDFNAPPPKLQTLPPYLVNLSESENKPPYLLYYKGVGIFPRGDIQALLGEQKSGKTTVARIFIAAMLKGQYLDFKTEDGAGRRILIADTEQSPYNVQQDTRRIHIAAGLNPYRNNPDLLVLQLRPYDKAERLRIVCDEVAMFHPDFVLLDGIIDVCEGFNDEKDSGKVIDKLLPLSANNKCAILCVMHHNKDKETARGHLGAMLQQKGSESYEVKRNGNRTEVKMTFFRNEEMPPFAFEVDKDGDSEQIILFSCTASERQDNEKAELCDLMRQVFKEEKPMRRKDLITAVASIKKIAERTAWEEIRRATQLGIVSKGEGKQAPYMLQEVADFAGIPTKEMQGDEDPI